MLVIESKKLTITQKVVEFKITTQQFNKLTSENFTARLKQTNLASKNYITDFVKKTDFDNKLKDATSNKNELHEQSKKVKAI